MTRKEAWEAVCDALAYESTGPELIVVNQQRLINCVLKLVKHIKENRNAMTTGDIAARLEDLAAMLPAQSRHGRKTIREACLVRHSDGTWSVLAGGHPSVPIGEWGGDFDGDGDTAEAAIDACVKSIRQTR